MTAFNATGGISVLELVVYFPALIAATFICYRHGFGRSSGWIYTLILCIVRIIGACCQLATYNNHSTGLLQATIIIELIGISPLLLATLGLMSRLSDSVNRSHKGPLGVKHFRVLQLVITLGLILSIVGGTSTNISQTGSYTPAATSKAGVILYLVGFIAICIVALITITHLSSAQAGEDYLAYAVVFAMPFVLVRIIYSILAVFIHNKDFSVVGGRIVIRVFMAVLEEIVVVLIYIVLGFMIPVLSPGEKGPTASRGPGRGRGQQTQTV